MGVTDSSVRLTIGTPLQCPATKINVTVVTYSHVAFIAAVQGPLAEGMTQMLQVEPNRWLIKDSTNNSA